MDIFSNGLILYLLFIIALIGLCMGSFLNCLSYRLSNRESIIKGRSHCPNCNHILGAMELIPVFSYLLQGGKCKSCKVKIPIRYPLAEILTMTIFLSIVMKYSYSLDTFMYLILSSIILVAVFTDIETMTIPDSVHVFALINWLIFAVLRDEPMVIIQNGLIGGVGFLIGMLLLVKLADKIMKRETMGGADIKLLAVTGFYFGLLGNMLLLMISCFVGILFAFFTGRFNKEFPFGPSIGIAIWFSILYGDNILIWYMGFF